ncbi:MAG: sugar phosphate isomerase/epimerase family protein [Eubacteriales bacterium]
MDIGLCVSHSENICDTLRGISERGFDNCQLLSSNSSLWTDGEARDILSACEKYGVRITAFFWIWDGPSVWDFYDGQETLGLVPPAYRAERMRSFLKGAEFAHKLGVRDVITHVGFIPENPHDPIYLSLVSALRYIVSRLRERGQHFLFETGQETPVTLMRIIEDIGYDNVGINLDPANLILYGKASPVDALDMIGRYVRGVHGKDGLYPTNGRSLGQEVPLGEGKVNFEALIPKLHSMGYNGSITIEREIEGEEQQRDIIKGRRLLEDIIGRLQ